MLRHGQIRSTLAVLLAVATAIGSLPALGRACQCPTPLPQHLEPVTAPASCCAIGSCCTGSSCCAPAHVSQPCSCALCECESPAPAKPDSVPPAAPVDSNALEFASAPPAPALPLALPADAIVRLGEARFDPVPPDLVILFARLNC